MADLAEDWVVCVVCGCQERVNAEQQHRIYRERRERLERARLSAAAKSLKEARRRLWEGVEKTVLAIFKE